MGQTGEFAASSLIVRLAAKPPSARLDSNQNVSELYVTINRTGHYKSGKNLAQTTANPVKTAEAR